MLAVLGHTTRDFVDGLPARPGGVPLYAALALRALGEPGIVVTRCAPQDEVLLVALRGLGLPVVWRPESISATFRLHYGDGERERAMSIEALGDPWLPEDVGGWIGEAIRDTRWVHAGALWRDDFPATTLGELAQGRRLCLDGQGLARPGVIGPVRLDGSFDPALLASLDVLHLSEAEAAALDLSLDAVSLGSLGVPEVVVTLGERGSIVLAGGGCTHVPARAVSRVDTTGAGDAFMSAYLASRAGGAEAVPAARRATAVVRALLEGRAA